MTGRPRIFPGDYSRWGIVAPRPGEVREVSTQAPSLVIRVKVSPALGKGLVNGGSILEGRPLRTSRLEPIRGLRRAFREHSVEGRGGSSLLIPCEGGYTFANSSSGSETSGCSDRCAFRI